MEPDFNCKQDQLFYSLLLELCELFEDAQHYTDEVYIIKLALAHAASQQELYEN